MPKGYKIRICRNAKCRHHGKQQVIPSRNTACECGTAFAEPA
jgi:hypothetical protein